jgi:myo-inositol-1(or 4)-monophosphatase
VTTVASGLVRSWAEEAGALAYSFFHRVEARRKHDGSVVTQADTAVESLLAERIAAQFPDHGLLGEEGLRHGLDREFVWVIDPLDGTASFAAGLPTWAVSIGLFRNGRPLLGVIHLPVLRDMYWNEPDGSALLNGVPIRVRAAGPHQSGDWLAVPSMVHRGWQIDYPGKVRVLGSVASDLCYVARGAAIAGVIGRAHVWDIAAGLAILAAAGGSVEYLDGGAPDTAQLLQEHRLAAPILIGAAERIPLLRGQVTLRRRSEERR